MSHLGSPILYHTQNTYQFGTDTDAKKQVATSWLLQWLTLVVIMLWIRIEARKMGKKKSKVKNNLKEELTRCSKWPNRKQVLISEFPVPSIMPRRRQWHPTPVLLPGKSYGQSSLVGCSPWGREELDSTKQLPFHFSLSCLGEGNGNPLQYSCLEIPRDRVAQSLWGRTESDTTEAA